MDTKLYELSNKLKEQGVVDVKLTLAHGYADVNKVKADAVKFIEEYLKYANLC